MAQRVHPEIHGWQDIDLEGPRHPGVSKWVMAMLRMEEGFLAEHPEDPLRGPDIRTEEERERDRAALLIERGLDGDLEGGTQDESALEVELECCGEGGETDASSVTTNDDRDLPTGLHWRDGEPSPWPRPVGQRRVLGKSTRRALAAAEATWAWDYEDECIRVWLDGQRTPSPPGTPVEESMPFAPTEDSEDRSRPVSPSSTDDAPGEPDETIANAGNDVVTAPHENTTHVDHPPEFDVNMAPPHLQRTQQD
ncbi:hypothetical protein FS749_000183 [Ceratobasidium sp. UAMH 11750]|nr:hypothetical protein FS749_000183 [Ceratobasidium sp. UAMH 11750]